MISRVVTPPSLSHGHSSAMATARSTSSSWASMSPPLGNGAGERRQVFLTGMLRHLPLFLPAPRLRTIQGQISAGNHVTPVSVGLFNDLFDKPAKFSPAHFSLLV